MKNHRDYPFLFFYLLFSLSAYTEENNQIPNPQKSSTLSADIYEKTQDTKSFSDKVNLIRESDTIEVFFQGKIKGPFVLKDGPELGLFKERLIKSQKSQNQKVTVKIVDDTITSVVLEESKSQNKKDDMKGVLDDILKK